IVRIAQTRLRGGDAVLGGARPPDDRLRIVVRDTAALAEHAAETLLCERVTGLRGFAIPPRGLREVLLDPGAALVERGQARLRRRIAALGERPDDRDGLSVITAAVGLETARQTRGCVLGPLSVGERLGGGGRGRCSGWRLGGGRRTYGWRCASRRCRRWSVGGGRRSGR